MSKQNFKENIELQLAGNLFSASAGIIVFLASTLAVLLSTYKKIESIPWLKDTYEIGIWVCLLVLLLFCIISFLSITHIWNRKVPIVIPTIIFAFVLISVFMGSIILVLITVQK